MIIGKYLRDLREKKGILLRQAAAYLEVDTAYISKMERGEKNIKRAFIEKLAVFYETDADELITTWIADQVYDLVKDEKHADAALNMVIKKLK